MSNPSDLSENEKPGALAGATGHVENDLAITGSDYPKPRRNAMSLYAKDSHKRAARTLGYALTADDSAVWALASGILAHRLTRLELVSIAFSALRALEPADREAVFNAAQWGAA